ncbi:unnamed protein product [Lampetra fluviatilis]
MSSFLLHRSITPTAIPYSLVDAGVKRAGKGGGGGGGTLGMAAMQGKAGLAGGCVEGDCGEEPIWRKEEVIARSATKEESGGEMRSWMRAVVYFVERACG